MGVPSGARQRGLTVAILAHNEAGRYLAEVLAQWAPVADRLLVVDDASTDGTAEVARAAGAGVVPAAVLDPEADFAHEDRLRTAVWRAATHPRPPTWIALPDADELTDPPPARWLPRLLASSDVAALTAPLYDLWDDRRHYRDDRLWSAHNGFWPLIVRYRPVKYLFSAQGQHCGRWPLNAIGAGLTVREQRVRILHLGWLRPEDRLEKHARYLALDPDARWGSADQYASILDPHPHLRRLPALPGLAAAPPGRRR